MNSTHGITTPKNSLLYPLCYYIHVSVDYSQMIKTWDKYKIIKLKRNDILKFPRVRFTLTGFSGPAKFNTQLNLKQHLDFLIQFYINLSCYPSSLLWFNSSFTIQPQMRIITIHMNFNSFKILNYLTVLPYKTHSK